MKLKNTLSLALLPLFLGACTTTFHAGTKIEQGEDVISFAKRAAVQRTYEFDGTSPSELQIKNTTNTFFSSQNESVNAFSFAYLGSPFGVGEDGPAGAIKFLATDFMNYCKEQAGVWNNSLCSKNGSVIFKLEITTKGSYFGTAGEKTQFLGYMGKAVYNTGAPLVTATVIAPKIAMKALQFQNLLDNGLNWSYREVKMIIASKGESRRVDVTQQIANVR